MSRTGRAIVIVVTIAVVAMLVYSGYQVGLGLLMSVELRDLRPKLLGQADHQALLDACRELSARVTSGKLEANYYRVRFRPHSEVSQFPQAIRALRPRFVTITDHGVVRVEMNTKWWSFGLFAYPDGYEKRFSEFRGGDRKLLEGLWYYDDEYRIDPNYDREVDAILKEHGKLPMQAAAASDPE